MKGYIGITSYDWWNYLKNKDIKYVNFWNKKKAFKVLDTGDLFFFLKKNAPGERGERVVVGYADYYDFEYLDVVEAWEKYKDGNGHPDEEDFLQSMGGVLGEDNLKEIGCIILTNYKEFKTPVQLSEIGIEFANSIVSGKSIDWEECEKIINAGDGALKRKANDINSPLEPKGIAEINGKMKVICGNCEYKFEKAPRCPECGQLIKY